jgi:hypothetical protein
MGCAHRDAGFVKTFVVVLLALAFAGLSAASFISLTPEVSVETIAFGEETAANFSLTNSGDEPAYDVTASLLLPEGMSSSVLYLGRLDENATQSGGFGINAAGVLPGAYSIPLRVDYKDANGHPFSAVSVFSLIIKEAAFSEVSPRVENLKLAVNGQGSVRVSLKNLGSSPHDVRLRVFLPRELKADVSEKVVSVPADAEAEASFAVSSFDALAGSDYAVYAIVSYEDARVYRSSYSSSVVSIVEPQPMPLWIPLAALAVLVIVFVAYQFKK